VSLQFEGLILPALAFRSLTTRPEKRFQIHYVENGALYSTPSLEGYEDDYVKIDHPNGSVHVTPKQNVFVLTQTVLDQLIMFEKHYYKISGKLRPLTEPKALPDNTILRTPKRVIIINLSEAPGLSLEPQPERPNFSPAIFSQIGRHENKHGKLC